MSYCSKKYIFIGCLISRIFGCVSGAMQYKQSTPSHFYNISKVQSSSTGIKATRFFRANKTGHLLSLPPLPNSTDRPRFEKRDFQRGQRTDDEPAWFWLSVKKRGQRGGGRVGEDATH